MRAMSESGQVEAPSSGHIFRKRQAATVALALLLTCLLATGCGRTTQTIARGEPRATPTATHISATPTATLPPAPLSWVPGSLPPGNVLPGGTFADPLAVSPSDGATAYTCGAPASISQGAIIWVTHDNARHWTQLAPLPVVPNLPHILSNCWIVPDAVDPSILVGEVSWQREQAIGAPYFMDGTHFVSFDGGESWQPLRGPKPFNIFWMATYRGVTMADVETEVPGYSAFWISYDQMQTWQSSSAVPATRDMSINPTTGELLGEISMPAEPIGVTEQLDTSSDDGLHWTMLSTPPDWSTPMISPPEAGLPWRICVLTQSGDSSSSTLMCSLDGGKTWIQRPHLEITYTDPNTGPGSQSASEFALGPDGTVYADMPAIMPTIPDSAIPDTLYRLAPGSDRWQSLGTSPLGLVSQGGEYATVELPGAGIFWFDPSYAPQIRLFPMAGSDG